MNDISAKEVKLHSKRLGRELAMQYLFHCDMVTEFPDMGKWNKFYEEDLMQEHQLSQNRYSRKCKEFADSLISGIALNMEELDQKIIDFSKNWDWNRISNVDRNIMRVAIFEMIYLLDIPPVVSIDEAVQISRDYSGDNSCNFINGILNNIKDTLNRSAREAVKEEK